MYKGAVAPKTALPYGRDSCIAWNRCHIFMNKRGTYGIIADGLRFDTQLSNVYGNAIRAKLAAAQTTRSMAGSFSSFVTQNLFLFPLSVAKQADSAENAHKKSVGSYGR